jgi:hypothetical protein
MSKVTGFAMTKTRCSSCYCRFNLLDFCLGSDLITRIHYLIQTLQILYSSSSVLNIVRLLTLMLTLYYFRLQIGGNFFDHRKFAIKNFLSVQLIHPYVEVQKQLSFLA